MNVSFDYDSTLSTESVQRFAKYCIGVKLNVWIVTSRFPGYEDGYNKELFKLSQQLNIPRNQVIFTSGNLKSSYFKHYPDFLFHLDDRLDELKDISLKTDINAILMDDNWENKCWLVINEYLTNKA